jgi:hypothetical protein
MVGVGVVGACPLRVRIDATDVGGSTNLTSCGGDVTRLGGWGARLDQHRELDDLTRLADGSVLMWARFLVIAGVDRANRRRPNQPVAGRGVCRPPHDGGLLRASPGRRAQPSSGLRRARAVRGRHPVEADTNRRWVSSSNNLTGLGWVPDRGWGLGARAWATSGAATREVGRPRPAQVR